MPLQGLSPVRFNTVSMVTTALGVKDGELGDRFTEGGREYCLVYNGGNSVIPVGYGCVLQSAATNYTVTVSAATSADFVIGVVRHESMATGAYGYVVTKGITSIQMLASSGSVSVNGLVEIGANGLFAPVSNTTGNASPAVGKALAAIASGASGSAFVSTYG